VQHRRVRHGLRDRVVGRLVHVHQVVRHGPPLSETQYCNTGGDCPVRCAVSRWSDWGVCTRKCGGGKRSRARLVLRRAANSGTKCPALRAPCTASPTKYRSTHGTPCSNASLAAPR